MQQLLAEQIESVRRQVDEQVAAKLSNNYITRLLYDGSVRFASKLYSPTDDTYAFSSVNNQQGYPLPSNFVDITNMIWQVDVSHYSLNKMSRKEMLMILPQQGDPEQYAIDEANKQALLNPIPQGNAKNTTLSSGVGVGDTTINVVSTSGFGGLGYFTVDSETIQYTGITTTSFTGCIRGACGTTAATHLTSATVTWCDIVMYFTRFPKPAIHLITTSKVTTTNGSTAVVGDGTVLWVSGQNIYPGQYLGMGQLSTNTGNENFPLVWYKISSIGSTTSLTLATPFLEGTVSTLSPCIISDMCEFYEPDCAVLIAWACYQAELILGNKDKAENKRLAFNSAMADAMDRRNGPDNLITIKQTRFAKSVSTGGIQVGGHWERFDI
jgi:hypothetical protein